MKPINPATGKLQQETVTAEMAEQAFSAYRATQLAICHDPSLLENPYFIALQDAAYARFFILSDAL